MASTVSAAVPTAAPAALPEGMTKSAMSRILAIDYGRKRIGLALSDELGATAQPLLTIQRTNRRDVIRRLREICAKHGVAQIIVGHPLHMTGEAGEMAAEAASFAMRVSKELGIETELVDERLTTWEARQTMTETKSRRKGEPIDAIAAAVLLRDYLETHSEKMSHNNRRKRSES
jgi:putative Holliday junction resolvase